MDFTYLATQTFDDKDLENELLTLFLAQARQVVPALGVLDGAARVNAAHRLTGSARAIGAVAVAAAADACARDAGRHAALLVAFLETEAAIEARLGSGKTERP